MNGPLCAPLKLSLKILSSPQKCPPATSGRSHRGFSHEVNKPQALATCICLLRCMLARVCCLIPVTCTVHTSFLGHSRLPTISVLAPRALHLPLRFTFYPCLPFGFVWLEAASRNLGTEECSNPFISPILLCWTVAWELLCSSTKEQPSPTAIRLPCAPSD